MAQLKALLANATLRKFARDAIEAAIASVASLALTLPTSIPDAQKEALVIGVAVLSAVIAIARREVLPWVLEQISPTAPAPTSVTPMPTDPTPVDPEKPTA